MSGAEDDLSAEIHHPAPVDPPRLRARLRVFRRSKGPRPLEQVGGISGGKSRGRRPERSHCQGLVIFQTPCGEGGHLCMVSPSRPCHLFPGPVATRCTPVYSFTCGCSLAELG